jgi:transcription initiation factor IIE alpha subunit
MRIQNDIQSHFLAYLRKRHKGRKKAVTSGELESVFNIKGSEVRRIINDLRCCGHPVCSDNTGYYFAGNEKELNATIAQLTGRAEKILKARDGLVFKA